MIEDRVTQLSEHSKLIVRDIEKEMKTAFLEYSMSVIVSRALPDVRDGLKPVHRRILYTMYEKNNDATHAYKKSAETVGAVLGSYHPHGDGSVYDAMVRLAQDFSLRYPLVDGQGNFGSIDGDPPAAYRYTEARMSKISMDLLTDIDRDTVDFMPNFDETKQEPVVLPSRMPNLLINGSTGIAVGMATNIPPHNLNEVIDAVTCLIENPDAEVAELMDHISGPDFPTGGIIMGRSGIRSAYATGRGKIILRARTEIEEVKNGRFQIIVTEIPYMVNKSRLIESIADCAKEKRIEGISDLNDESTRKGMRIVIELKRDANPQVVLNQLFRYTQLQDTVGVIMIAIDKGEPKVMILKEILEKYLEFQVQVIRRRTLYDLKKAQDKAHILEGLTRAIDIVDDIIATIRSTKGSMSEAKEAVMNKFDFDEPQAAAIVAFRLGHLAGLEIVKIMQELGELQRKIAEWTELISCEENILRLIQTELTAIKEKYGDARRTDIENVSGEVDIEDLIEEEECVFTLTHYGYIKRLPITVYQSQKRGGRGITGLTRRDEDFVEELFVASTHDYIYFATDQGRLHRVKGYQVSEGSRTSKGLNIVNLLQLQNDEKVTSMIRIAADLEDGFITMVTKAGIIKRTHISKYKNIRKTGINAINIDEGDSLAWAKITTGEDELLVATRKGMAIRFKEEDARAVGRNSRGVKAIRLSEGDNVVGVSVAREGATVITVTDKGKGRRTKMEEYRLQNRAGKGIRNYGKTDLVAGIKVIDEHDDIILISLEGIIIRMHAEDINVQSRYASGVRVMRLSENDVVVTVARTERDDEAEAAKPEIEETDEIIDVLAIEQEEKENEVVEDEIMNEEIDEEIDEVKDEVIDEEIDEEND